jgi:hypothetical protein
VTRWLGRANNPFTLESAAVAAQNPAGCIAGGVQDQIAQPSPRQFHTITIRYLKDRSKTVCCLKSRMNKTTATGGSTISGPRPNAPSPRNSYSPEEAPPFHLMRRKQSPLDETQQSSIQSGHRGINDQTATVCHRHMQPERKTHRSPAPSRLNA